MTPNLKINRKALPTPEIKRVSEYVAPEGEMEAFFAKIFSQVLDIEQVGATDIEMVNIESVRHLISFCLRTDSRLIHISTNSVAGMSIDDVPGPEVKLTEQDFYIGQHVSDRKYTYSKPKN